MKLRTRYTHRLPVAPGLRLDIPMFEGSGTKVLDVSGKGNHGTITDALWTRDENGVAMSFNGTSAYIDCGNDPSLNITDAITIEAWIKQSSSSGNQNVISRDYGTNERTYEFRIGSGKFEWNLNEDGTVPGWHSCISDETIGTDWIYLVGTFDGDIMRIYFNGVEKKTTSATFTIHSANMQLNIGNRPDLVLYFNGAMDEVRIYALALTAEQIKRRYEQTKRDYVRAS